MTLCPIISRSTLSEDKVVWSEDLSEGSGPHTVHGAGLQVHEHCSGDVFAAAGLVIVHVDPLEL